MMATSEHLVLMVPGLGDNKDWQTNMLKLAVASWKKYGLLVEVYSFNWHDTETFESKLTKFLKYIASVKKTYSKVSLVGLSAGGSAVMNAFFKNQKAIYKVVSISGRLRSGSESGFRGFSNRTKTSLSFGKSVATFAKNEDHLSPRARKKVMTIYPLFGDELVPQDTAILPGATNISIPSIEHVVSIFLSLAVFKPLINFLKD